MTRSNDRDHRPGEAAPCAHDWDTIEGDDQAGEELVKCRRCGIEQTHAHRPETAEAPHPVHSCRTCKVGRIGTTKGCPECDAYWLFDPSLLPRRPPGVA